MKKLLLVFAIFLYSFELFSQPQYEFSSPTSYYYGHSFRDASISISPNVIINNSDKSVIAGGMKLRMFVGERFSFDSDLLLGRNYAHFGPGIIGLPLWYIGIGSDFSFSTEADILNFIFIGAIMLLSGEHFAYHIPVKNNTDISPYLSLLRFKQTYNDDLKRSENTVRFAVGLEMNRYYKRFVLSPYIDYDIDYSFQGHGFNIGVNLGYYFPAKD